MLCLRGASLKSAWLRAGAAVHMHIVNWRLRAYTDYYKKRKNQNQTKNNRKLVYTFPAL